MGWYQSDKEREQMSHTFHQSSVDYHANTCTQIHIACVLKRLVGPISMARSSVRELFTLKIRSAFTMNIDEYLMSPALTHSLTHSIIIQIRTFPNSLLKMNVDGFEGALGDWMNIFRTPTRTLTTSVQEREMMVSTQAGEIALAADSV